MDDSCCQLGSKSNRSTNFVNASVRCFRLAVLLGIALILAAGMAEGQTNPKHFFWAQGSPNLPSPSSLANDLIYHGGNAGSGAIGVETPPAVYVVFWGPDWANGFTVTDANGVQYTSQQLQSYVTSMLTNVGGTSWLATVTEYCKNVPAGTTACTSASSPTYVTNPRKQLKGVWTDSTAVPSDIVTSGLAQNLADDPIADEAMRASQHFNYDPQATYIILTPPTSTATGADSVYCGYHTQTTSVDGLGNPYRLQYAFIPYLDNDTGCGMNSVNVISDSFGHGVFDSYSIVIGHEYAEAITDPDNFSSVQDGWNDDQTDEIGDKCAWANLKNVGMYGGTSFAMQPLWSNRAFDAGGQGCVQKEPTSPHAMPPVGVMPPAVAVCLRRASRPASRCRSIWPISAAACRPIPRSTWSYGDGAKPGHSTMPRSPIPPTILMAWAHSCSALLQPSVARPGRESPLSTIRRTWTEPTRP